jgi:hypothetical protein
MKLEPRTKLLAYFGFLVLLHKNKHLHYFIKFGLGLQTLTLWFIVHTRVGRVSIFEHTTLVLVLGFLFQNFHTRLVLVVLDSSLIFPW